MEHHYGSHFHWIDSPVMAGILAKLCSPQVFQPEINRLVDVLYSHMIVKVMEEQCQVITTSTNTRMQPQHPDIQLNHQAIKAQQKIVVVNLARAGTYPSHICYNFLHNCIEQIHLRQDHIFAARVTDDSHQVTGTNIGAAKIGGDVADSLVLIPDPMGATGNTIVATINHYKSLKSKPATKYIALHLIVTPEYLRYSQKHHPDLEIYALRVDRGLSSEKALKALPGLYWNEEKGLNKQDYVVPGAGGFGEIMNNSFV